MKQNTKFLWIYTGILFSFALILILFAGLTQSSYKKELEEKETSKIGMQQSVTDLTQKNTMLNSEVNKLSEIIVETNEKLGSLTGEKSIMEQKLADAKALISNIDRDSLDEEQKLLYDNIMNN